MSWAESHKPAAAARVHLLLAGLMWTVVGATLAGFGARWLWQSTERTWPWLVIAMAIGVIKARCVLDRAARIIVARICSRGDGRCVGGFMSVRSWAMVVVMMLAGQVLRGSDVTRVLLGVLYVAVGTGLLLSSRIAWLAWRDGSRRLAG